MCVFPRVCAVAIWSLAVLLLVAPSGFAATDSIVTINELHYNPATPGGAGSAAVPEWMELHNPMSIRVDLGGWSVRGGVNYVFPDGTIMEPGSYLVVSAAAGVPTGAIGPLAGRMNNGGEEIRLHERWGRMMDRIDYRKSGEWPTAPDGEGPSLAKRRPESASELASSWVASAAVDGTPGMENFPRGLELAPRPVFIRGSVWKYEPTGAELPVEWVESGSFSDGAWMAGPAPLGTVAAGAATELPLGRAAYFFRKSFGWSGRFPQAHLLLTGSLEGVAEIYLNGRRLGRADGRGSFGFAASVPELVEGANVLAVKLVPHAAPAAAVVALDLALVVMDGETAVAPPLVLPPARSVVVNEMAYHARPTFADPAQGIAYAENPAEWIELHNTSHEPVDIGGWSLSEAVDCQFLPGTVIPPGGFKVIDRSQFSGSLANGGDLLRVLDVDRRVVDEVRFFDGGRWPELADGGGSTLERRDPRAAGMVAESWAASDERGRSEWQTVRYRALGAEPLGSNNPAVWREFLLGFLDAGEAFVDDLSVLEDPDGARVQCLQNGGFEQDVPGGGAAHWRLLGTHKLSRVVANPDGAGQVLHLIATGQHDHTYNTASTTLVGNRVINPSKTYEISFRARWISGSPQLNSRLYLNRAARTTLLAQPVAWGTPGAVNGRRLANAGPAMTGLRHSPLVPVAGQPVRISVSAVDPDGVASARLWFNVGQGAWRSELMGDDGRGRFFGVVPAQSNGAAVQFYVEAVDVAGAVSLMPTRGPSSRALYKVGDAGVSAQRVRNKMRLYMTPADAAELHNPIHSVSNFRWASTVIYNDRDVWYDVAIRLRSAPFGRQGNRAGWNLQFGSDEPFRGGLTSVVIDGAYNMPRTDGGGWLENSLGPSVNEMLFHAIANRAGGIPSSYDDVVYVQAPRATEGNRLAQLKLQRFNKGYLEETFPDGADGLLFKQELIYYPTSTVDGRPESLKNAFNAVLDTEIRSFGPSRDSYRFNYIPQNHQDRDDFDRIMALGQAFGASSATLYSRTAAVMDVDNWMRVFALNALTGLADTYNNGLAHNIQLYVRPGDGKVMLFPWDQDHAFYLAPTSSLYGAGSHRLAAVINLPANRRLYVGHLLDLCQTAFTNDFLDPVITHLHGSAVANRPQYASLFRSYVTNRRNYVLSQIAVQFPKVPFAVTSHSEAGVSTPQPFATIEGTGWIDVASLLVSRSGSTPRPAPVTWLDGRRWRLVLPVQSGDNKFTINAIDRKGAILGAAEVSVTNTGPTDPATAGTLAVTEIHYHPAGGAPTEFVELMNISGRLVDLTGVTFTGGVQFDFTGSSLTTLAPGERVVVVENRAAFVGVYGAGRPVAGEFSSTSSLANGGGRLTLLDRGGAIIADFRYGDALPWPPEADGLGWSLTAIHPDSAFDPSVATHWRPSRQLGGSPGVGDSLSQEDFPSLLDYAVVSGPGVGPASATPRLIWTERIGADEARVVIEYSEDMHSWSVDPGDGSRWSLVGATSMEGVRTLTAESLVPLSTPTFLRLRVVPR